MNQGGSTIFWSYLGLFWSNFQRRRQRFKKQAKQPCFNQTTLFGQIFSAAGNILNNMAKKAFFGTFWEKFDQKIAFFGAYFPLKISIYWRQRYSQKTQKPHPPKSAPDLNYKLIMINLLARFIRSKLN